MSEREEKQLYTLAEFFELVGERRMELYEGVPVLMAPASYEHEGVVANVIGEITFALKGSPCFVFGSNLQVVFLFQDEQKGKENVTVLPDISVVCEKEKLRNKRCYGAPDLVVEVLSPSTARNDRLLKHYYYKKAGVKEYWIVDYQHKAIEKYVLYKDCLQLEEVYDDQNDHFVSTLFPNIQFFIDRSSVELFVNGGRLVMTGRIYPSETSQGIKLFAESGILTVLSVEAWTLKDIWCEE